LESECNQLLLIDEEHWRQKSRAIWLKSGDRNTKFFHKFASAKRNQKHIWEIWDELGQEHRGQEALKVGANKYFKNLFSKDFDISFVEQMALARHFLCFVNAEDSCQIDRPVTKQGIWDVLKLFSIDKSPDSDGWTVEFYIN
jgi:hypothetical protein